VDLSGQDGDVKMKVKVISNMDDLEDMLNEAQAEVESFMKKKRKEEKESAEGEKEVMTEDEDKDSAAEETTTSDGEDTQKDTTLKFEK
jgi:hypothetical protein